MRKMHRKIYHMSRPVYREFDWLANRFLYIQHTQTYIFIHTYIYVFIRTSILYNEQYLHKFLNKSRGQQPQQVQPQTRQTLRSLYSSSTVPLPWLPLPARISAHCNALIMIIILEALISIWYSVGTFGLPFATANYSNMQTAQHLPSVVAVVVAVPSVVALVVVHAAVAVAVCSCSCRCQAAT